MSKPNQIQPLHDGRTPRTASVATANLLVAAANWILQRAALSEGATWQEFTVCDSGTPAPRWFLCSNTDPTAL